MPFLIRQLMVEFYILAFSRFPSRKKTIKSCFDKNRTHDFRISICAGYLPDHSGDEGLYFVNLILTDNRTGGVWKLLGEQSHADRYQ